MSGSAGSSEPAFEHLAHISQSVGAHVELCRIAGGELDGVVVAVKRPRLDAAEAAQLEERFRNETRMTSSLIHPHLVRLLCWGTDHQGPYFATEFVRGVSASRLLRTVVRTGDSFPERVVAALAVRVCRGLAAAHRLRAPSGEPLNLVHRDLTPDNVLLGFDGAVKISDFGLAKTQDGGADTAVGVLKGTSPYMAPEQILGDGLDGRADIFSLGVMMFELLCGRRPWLGATAVDTLKQIVEQPAPRLTALRRGLPEGLALLVERCLAKDRSVRMASAVDLEAALGEWLAAQGQSDSEEHLARFVRRHGRRQMRWCDRAVAGELAGGGDGDLLVPSAAGDEAMAVVSRARGCADTVRDPETEPAGGTPLAVPSGKPPSALPRSATEPDLSMVREDTLDTEVTMPSVLAKIEAAQRRAEAAAQSAQRPRFVAQPRSQPPPGPATQTSPPRRSAAPGDAGEPLAAAEASAAAGGSRGGAVYRQAKEITAAAAELGVRSDRAAGEALDAAQRARMAAEAARVAAERAEYGGRAAILAERAIAAIGAGDFDSAEALLERAKELRLESSADHR